MKPSRRYHPYGCKRDKEYVGSLGRMSDEEYNDLCERIGAPSHVSHVVDKSKIRKLTAEEYHEMQENVSPRRRKRRGRK